MLAIVFGPFMGNLIMLGVSPFFPSISSDLGVSVPALGQVVSGMLLLSAVLALIVGPLADQYGHRRLLTIGVIAASTSLISFGLAPSYWFLILAGLIGGLATASLPSLSTAVAGSFFSGDERRRALGWSSSAGAGSAVVGVPLLVGLSDFVGWRTALIVAGVVALGGIWLIGAAIPRVTNDHRSRLAVRFLKDAYRPLLGHGPTARLLGATVLRNVCWSGYLTYLAALMHSRLGLTTAQIGAMFLIGGGMYVFGSLSTRRLLSKVNVRLTVALANASMGLMVALVFSGALGVPATLVMTTLTGIAAGVAWVSIVTLLAEESPAGAGTTMAANSAAFNLGAAGGGALGGLMLALGGYSSLGIVLALFALAGATLVSLRSHAIVAVPSP